MADVVNLDALIPRDDFLISDGVEAGASGKQEASLTDLKQGESFFLTLRKPDFQRETAAWSPQAVADFIAAFVGRDLIPSVICWQSETRLSFVIDGAHRLSAIIAWLRDDYGDGPVSSAFYGQNITDEQHRISAKTKALVDKMVGPYSAYKAEGDVPGTHPNLAQGVLNLGNAKIPLLWVPHRASQKAEEAFQNINRLAVPIDPTELQILQNRFTPNVIAARAIIRNGSGYKYWKTFAKTGQQTVVSLGQAINKMLYKPALQQPIRTEDLPIAGHGYGSRTLPLIFDFVNIANGAPVSDATRRPKGAKSNLKKQDEAQEVPTIESLKKTDQLAKVITGTDSSSLGLHPAIYFYAANGRHQPTAVLAIASLVKGLVEADRLADFTRVRARFEDFLINHKMFVNQLTTQHGSMSKGYRQVRDYFAFVLDKFVDGSDEATVSNALQHEAKYQRLVKEKPLTTKQAKPFSSDLKTWAFLKTAIDKAMTCHLCGARIDPKAMHLDHVVKLSEGGLGDGENAAWAHPYCDSAKDVLKAKGAISAPTHPMKSELRQLR